MLASGYSYPTVDISCYPRVTVSLGYRMVVVSYPRVAVNLIRRHQNAFQSAMVFLCPRPSHGAKVNTVNLFSVVTTCGSQRKRLVCSGLLWEGYASLVGSSPACMYALLMYVCMYVFVCCVCVCVCWELFGLDVCTYVCMYALVHVCMHAGYINMLSHVYIHSYTNPCQMHTNICMNAHMYIYIYIYIKTRYMQ